MIYFFKDQKFKEFTNKREIRYRPIFVTNVGSPDFKIGLILLIFQIDRKIPSLRDLLKIMQIM